MRQSHPVDEHLVNWAFWCEWGILGPPVQTKAASAEGNYTPELGDIYDPPEPSIEPNVLDGERMEMLVRELPNMQRMVVKAKFVSYPYHGNYTIAQKLKISTDRFESELRKAKEGLWRRWNNEQRHGYKPESVS
jgi:DNA-directed RNA polymerase specialized sigma24 family protein